MREWVIMQEGVVKKIEKIGNHMNFYKLALLFISITIFGMSMAETTNAAINFDFMDKPAAFDKTEAEKLLNKIDMSELASSTEEIKERIEEKAPGLTGNIVRQFNKVKEWFQNEAGIDIKNIFISIWASFISAIQWLVEFIKNLLN